MKLPSANLQSPDENTPPLLVPNGCDERTVHGLVVPVATNVTDGRPATAADNEFWPAELPRVQLPTVATPAGLVTAVAPAIDPPPDTTAKLTDTPDFGLPLASFT